MEPRAVAQMTDAIIATREQYVAAAREFLGVRWQHQGRSAQGVDCVGLLVVPAIRLGVLTPGQDVTDYSRQQDGSQLAALLHRHCRRLPHWREASPGDILALRYADQPQHVAIVTRAWDARWGFKVLHAYGNDAIGGQVIEHRLDADWLRSHRAEIHAAFAIRGLG